MGDFQMDKIVIKDLEVFARHGVLKEENALGQKFIISAELFCDIRPAGRSDKLENSVNYAKVCELIKKNMTENTYKLIETAAESIAEQILLGFDKIKGVKIGVKKPWAPILTNVDYVGVEITRMRHTAYIALGSNIGDTRAQLENAVREIDESKYCSVKKVSDFIVTKPVGDVLQDDFLNGCIETETLLSPHELLDFLHEIEKNHGRERIVHWGPRTLDLDIILYDDIIMNDEDLIIPHPEAANREFVLEPLSQIAPFAYHPIKKDVISNLLADFRQSAK